MKVLSTFFLTDHWREGYIISTSSRVFINTKSRHHISTKETTEGPVLEIKGRATHKATPTHWLKRLILPLPSIHTVTTSIPTYTEEVKEKMEDILEHNFCRIGGSPFLEPRDLVSSSVRLTYGRNLTTHLLFVQNSKHTK